VHGSTRVRARARKHRNERDSEQTRKGVWLAMAEGAEKLGVAAGVATADKLCTGFRTNRCMCSTATRHSRSRGEKPTPAATPRLAAAEQRAGKVRREQRGPRFGLDPSRRMRTC
jgi:hypothetical protein